jgi:hypothetical protein
MPRRAGALTLSASHQRSQERLTAMSQADAAHRRVLRHTAEKAPVTADEHFGFNGRLAVLITKSVGSMWCA